MSVFKSVVADFPIDQSVSFWFREVSRAFTLKVYVVSSARPVATYPGGNKEFELFCQTLLKSPSKCDRMIFLKHYCL